MSEPLPVAQTFLFEDFDGRCKLDSIVCLVDAQNFRHNLVQSLTTTFEQIEHSNFVILNKVDEVSTEEINTIKKTIKELNKYCVIVETNHGIVDPKYVLDTTSFEMTQEIEHKLHQGHHHDHDHNHDHGHHHDHHGGITEYLFKTQETCYNIENMRRFL
jgi:G3E family GTPase